MGVVAVGLTVSFGPRVRFSSASTAATVGAVVVSVLVRPSWVTVSWSATCSESAVGVSGSRVERDTDSSSALL